MADLWSPRALRAKIPKLPMGLAMLSRNCASLNSSGRTEGVERKDSLIAAIKLRAGMSKPASNKVLEKALTAELEGLQKIHVAVAKQITRLQYEEAVLNELLEKAKAESAQQEQPAVQFDTEAAVEAEEQQ